jgi:hypothetical protein
VIISGWIGGISTAAIRANARRELGDSEGGVNECVGRVARGWMGDHVSWLVKDEDVRIFKEDVHVGVR